MKSQKLHDEKDPLAVHIFVSRRNHRKAHDTKQRQETTRCRAAQLAGGV